MTDANLLDADCLHGGVWWECVECARLDRSVIDGQDGFTPDSVKYAHPKTRQRIVVVDGVDGLTPDMLRRRKEMAGLSGLLDKTDQPVTWRGGPPRWAHFQDPMHD